MFVAPYFFCAGIGLLFLGEQHFKFALGQRAGSVVHSAE